MVLIIPRETKGEKFMHLHYTHKRDYTRSYMQNNNWMRKGRLCVSMCLHNPSRLLAFLLVKIKQMRMCSVCIGWAQKRKLS